MYFIKYGIGLIMFGSWHLHFKIITIYSYEDLYALDQCRDSPGMPADHKYWSTMTYVYLLNEMQQVNLGYFVMHHFFFMIKKNPSKLTVHCVPLKPILFIVFIFVLFYIN